MIEGDFASFGGSAAIFIRERSERLQSFILSPLIFFCICKETKP